MPSKIQNATAISRLVRAFGIQGKMPLDLDSTVVPVAIVEDLSGSEEAQPTAATAFVRAPAIAAIIGACVLRNPAGSGVDLVVDRLAVSLAATPNTIRIYNTDEAAGVLIAAPVLNNAWNDSNLPDTPPGVLSAERGDVFTNFLDQRFVIDGAAVILTPEFVLAPGFACIAQCRLINLRLDTTFFYRVQTRN